MPEISSEELKIAKLKHVLDVAGTNEPYISSSAKQELAFMEEDKKNIECISRLNNCYKLINAVISDYIDMPENYRKFASIWIIGTYFHEQFNTYPYLFFNAMRGSAKTRMLKLISSLGHKGDGSVINNLTEAVLFRIPRNTVTCIDEFEQVNNREKQTLREILNSSYKKGMKVKRMKKKTTREGEEQVVDTFEPYFPIAMCNIWGVEEVLADRSITLILEKSDNPFYTKKIEDFGTNEDISFIKQELSELLTLLTLRYAKKEYIYNWNNYIREKYHNSHNVNNIIYINNINNINNVINTDLEELELFNKIDEAGISGRNFELMLPILLTAKMISEDVFNEVLTISKELTTKKKEEEYADSKDVGVYEFVSGLDCLGQELMAVKELTQRFRNFLGETENDDKWLNEKWLGRSFKRLNLITYKVKKFNGSYVILNYAKAREKLKMFKDKDEVEA